MESFYGASGYLGQVSNHDGFQMGGYSRENASGACLGKGSGHENTWVTTIPWTACDCERRNKIEYKMY